MNHKFNVINFKVRPREFTQQKLCIPRKTQHIYTRFLQNVAAQTRHLFARETFDPFVPTIMFRKLRHGDKGAPGANETEGKRGGASEMR